MSTRVTFMPASTNSWIRAASRPRLHQADAGLGLARHETHEAADAPEVLAEHVAPDIDLGAGYEPLPAARVAQRQVVLALVVDRRSNSRSQRAIAQLESAAEGGIQPMRKLCLCAPTPSWARDLATPVPDDVPVVGQTRG